MASSNSTNPPTRPQSDFDLMAIDTKIEASHSSFQGKSPDSAATQAKAHGGCSNKDCPNLPAVQQGNEILQAVNALSEQLNKVRTESLANAKDLQTIRERMDTQSSVLYHMLGSDTTAICNKMDVISDQHRGDMEKVKDELLAHIKTSCDEVSRDVHSNAMKEVMLTHNRVARLLNSKIKSDQDPLVPLRSVCTFKEISRFPANFDDLRQFSELAVDELYNKLYEWDEEQDMDEQAIWDAVVKAIMIRY